MSTSTSASRSWQTCSTPLPRGHSRTTRGQSWRALAAVRVRRMRRPPLQSDVRVRRQGAAMRQVGADHTPRQVFRSIQRHLPPALALAGKLAGQGAVEANADGARITLSDGRKVLDFGSYAVALLGHRNAAVVDVVRAQLAAMPVSSRTLVNPVTVRAAEEVVGYLDGALPRVYFGLTGADAVEAATKLARIVTGRPRVL